MHVHAHLTQLLCSSEHAHTCLNVYVRNEIRVLASPFLSAGNKNIECPPDPFIERELRPQRNLGQAPLIWRLQYYSPSQPRQYERPFFFFLNRTVTSSPEGQQRDGTQEKRTGGGIRLENYPLFCFPSSISQFVRAVFFGRSLSAPQTFSFVLHGSTFTF